MQIIIFDGCCNLCNGLARWISKRDRKEQMHLVPSQSEEGEKLLSKYGFNPKDISTVIYLRDDQIFTKSTAILNIFRDLGSGYRILYYMIIIPRPLRDLIYRLISHYRFRVFGRKKECSY